MSAVGKSLRLLFANAGELGMECKIEGTEIAVYEPDVPAGMLSMAELLSTKSEDEIAELLQDVVVVPNHSTDDKEDNGAQESEQS